MIPHRHRAAALALALLAATPCAAQKSGDSNGPFGISTNTDRPLRAVYRAAIDAVLAGGYHFQVMSLDQALYTLPREGKAGKPVTMARILFRLAEGDSTGSMVQAVALNAAQNERCTTDVCLAAELEAAGGIVAAIQERLKTYQAPPRSAADSLAAAKAFGYAPENPVKVGGGAEHGVQNEHAWLDTLRGPNGETVTWLRLGSCCAFETPNAPPDMEGHGMLDAYEVTYPGIAHPVLLYLDLYDPAEEGVPPGFVRLAPPKASP